MSVSEGVEGNLERQLTAVLNDPQVGGVAGLARTFYAEGLGRVMASWIGPGPNEPISAPQVQRVLGASRLEQIASRMNTTTARVASAVAVTLPGLIDALTPNGQFPPFPLP
jgi:uncharacterized protein YidB (DUF937 family)